MSQRRASLIKQTECVVFVDRATFPRRGRAPRVVLPSTSAAMPRLRRAWLTRSFERDGRDRSEADSESAVKLSLEAGKVDAAGDVVLDPVRVPPFLRINLHAVELHGEVDVIAARHAGHAALAHDLAALDSVSDMDADLAHVAVDGLQAVSMVDHDAVAIDAKRRS